MREALMFRKRLSVDYDPTAQRPVIRCSICTGEQAAGFQNLRTGEFREFMLIRSERDAQEFARACGVERVEKIY